MPCHEVPEASQENLSGHTLNQIKVDGPCCTASIEYLPGLGSSQCIRRLYVHWPNKINTCSLKRSWHPFLMVRKRWGWYSLTESSVTGNSCGVASSQLASPAPSGTTISAQQVSRRLHYGKHLCGHEGLVEWLSGGPYPTVWGSKHHVLNRNSTFSPHISTLHLPVDSWQTVKSVTITI